MTHSQARSKMVKLTETQQSILTLVTRLSEYEAVEEQTRLTNLLVEKWRANFPDAAKETSNYLKPLMRYEIGEKERSKWPGAPDELWMNEIYHVTLRRHKIDPVFDSKGGMIQLGINSIDGTARHDWRDMQAIKNQLAGPECEGFELFPAESRLLDPSNYYSLWCFPSVNKLNVGHDGRRVMDSDASWASQRSFPKPIVVVDLTLEIEDLPKDKGNDLAQT